MHEGGVTLLGEGEATSKFWTGLKERPTDAIQANSHSRSHAHPFPFRHPSVQTQGKVGECSLGERGPVAVATLCADGQRAPQCTPCLVQPVHWWGVACSCSGGGGVGG